MEIKNPQVVNQSMTDVSDAPSAKAAPTIRSATEIQAWVVNYLADLLEVEPEEVDTAIPFDRFGLDSSAAVGLTGDLADWLGCEVDPTLLYDYPTIESLVKHLSTQLN